MDNFKIIRRIEILSIPFGCGKVQSFEAHQSYVFAPSAIEKLHKEEIRAQT